MPSGPKALAMCCTVIMKMTFFLVAESSMMHALWDGGMDGWTDRWPYLSESLPLPDVFFRLGVGILHSMLKATQFVHGTPSEAASHRTYGHTMMSEQTGPQWQRRRLSLSQAGCSVGYG